MSYLPATAGRHKAQQERLQPHPVSFAQRIALVQKPVPPPANKRIRIKIIIQDPEFVFEQNIKSLLDFGLLPGEFFAPRT